MTIMRASTLALLVLLALTGSAQAQSWSGILSPSRAINWSLAGVQGGIPARATICSTLSPGVTAAQINTAISNCPTGQVVKLNPGTYTLSGGLLFNGKNDVTLRGSGPDSTFLIFTGSDSCTGSWGATICVRGSGISYYGPSPTYTTTWSAGSYTQGQTQITVASTANMAVGQWIVLDQLDDTTPGTDIFVNNDSAYTSEGGTDYGRPGRQQRQWVKISNISGNVVTFTPGLYAPNWSGSKAPGAWWGAPNGLVRGVGIEDMSVDAKNSGSGAAIITFIFAYNSWAKNVRLIYAPNPRAYVTMAWAHHITVRDSYMFGSVSEGTGPLHYGVDATVTQDCLVENNIIQRRTSPIVSNGDAGSVYSYNFFINDQYSVSPIFMQASNYSHEAGNHMILHESNQAVGIKGDIVHGTSNLFTHFRNYSIGWEPGKSSETAAVNLYSYNRYWNLIGNVLGQDGYHTAYSSTSTRNGTIFALDGSDSVVSTSLMRWGNYDTVNDATRWVASEVPSGLAKYSNPVPTSQTLPNSFYLSSKPAFYGTNPWPSIGPDITDGTGPGNHVRRIPARVCFENIMGGTFADTIPRSFNANTCYGTGGGGTSTQPPPSPQNLTVQ